MRVPQAKIVLAALAAVVIACAALGAGCVAPTNSPYQPADATARDPEKAGRLTRAAAEVLERRDPPDADALTEAERLLREALAADLYHGPAHNNLGVLFLRRGELYEAASEFEWARKLLPGNPDPRLNLGLVLETAERTDDALAAYRAALEVEPEHVPTVQALVRLQFRRSRTDDRTTEFLRLVSLRGDSEDWRTWAQSQLAARRVR